MDLEDIEQFLRSKSQNRVIDKSQGFSVFDFLVKALNYALETLLRTRNVEADLKDRSKKIKDEIRSSICDLLLKHSKKFQSVLSLLVENFPSQESSKSPTEKEIYEFYEAMISDIYDGRNLHQYTKLLLYAASTCIDTPIYVVCRNEFSRFRWTCFQPLFTYECQPDRVLKYVTIAMTSKNIFYNVESRDISEGAPKSSGLFGMYLEAFEDISPLDIDVPDELLALSDDQKSTLCHAISHDTVVRLCSLFLKRHYINSDEKKKMTAHRASRTLFCRMVTRSADAFQALCQVLINIQDKNVLSKFVRDWNNFGKLADYYLLLILNDLKPFFNDRIGKPVEFYFTVKYNVAAKSCDYLQRLDSCTALDNAIVKRNIYVSSFVDRCQLARQEFDERRKRVITAVIASSSVGIVSGCMFITGLVLAPFSFGASLGLSIAGGVIGVGTGVASGTARTVEAVKQNSKMKDIKEEQAIIQEMERDVSNALKKAQLLFSKDFRLNQDAENIGISRRGFLAVGSAFRVSHSAVNIALAAVRLSATAATVAGAVIGPLSLVVDIGFLAEAAHSKAKGDKTNAGEILQAIAETVETKSKIFNSMLRGNLNATHRIQMK